MTAKQILFFILTAMACTSVLYGQENHNRIIENGKDRNMQMMQFDHPYAGDMVETFKLRADSILKTVDMSATKRPVTGYWHTGKSYGDRKLPVFDRNPYALDFKSGMDISRWNNGGLTVNMSRTTYPGLMSVASGNVSLIQNAGNFTFTANMNANRMLMQKGFTTQYGIGGSATYRFNDNISATLFGNFYNTVPYMSMATMPYIGTSSFGGYMTFMQDKAGIDLGAERVYDPYSRRWITVPIVTPKIKINEKITLDIPLGWFVRDLLDDLINNNRRQSSPTILPSFPPPVVR